MKNFTRFIILILTAFINSPLYASTTPMNDCGTTMTAAQSVAPISSQSARKIVIQDLGSLRSEWLTRLKDQGDDFSMPELAETVSWVQEQIPNLYDHRQQKAHLLREGARIVNSSYPYRTTIYWIYEFVKLIEAQSKWTDVSLRDRIAGWYFHLHLTAYPEWVEALLDEGVFIFPTPKGVTKRTINRLWVKGTMIAGIVKEATPGDGYEMTPKFYWTHDIFHAFRSFFWLWDGQLDDYLDTPEEKWISFFYKIDSLENDGLSYLIDETIFEITHERSIDPHNLKTILSESGSHRKKILAAVAKANKNQYSKNQIGIAIDWIIENWPLNTPD